MFLRGLIIFLIAGSGNLLAQPFLYDIAIDRIREAESRFTVEASVRAAGEPYTRIRVSTSPDSAIRRLFELKHTTGDLEYSYFRIRTREEIPMALPIAQWPHLDVITKEVMDDISLNEQHRRKSADQSAWDGHLNPFPLDDTSIISISEISQNDFLGIKPRIVIPPGK
jgi:hypothetical protein